MSDSFRPPRLPLTRAERVTVVLLSTAFTGLLAAEVLSNLSPEKLSLPFTLLWWAPMLVLHELGHALTAKLLGWEISEMVLGFGRDVARFRVGDTLVRLKTLPIEGCVLPSPTNTRGARYKSALIFLAGPGAELLFILLLRIWLGPDLFRSSAELGMLFWQGAALAAAIGATFNLLPFGTSDGVSDGLGTILSLFSADADFQLRLAQPHALRARRQLWLEQPERALESVERGLKAHPDSTELVGLKAVCWSALGKNDEALDLLESLGHPDDQPAAIRTELLLDAAWCVLLSGQHSLLHQAQLATRRATEQAPGLARAHLLHGRVLWQRGQLAAALDALLLGYSAARDVEEEGQLVGSLLLATHALRDEELLDRFRSEFQRANIGPNLRADVLRSVEAQP